MPCASCGDPADRFHLNGCDARQSGRGCCKRCCVCQENDRGWLSNMEQDEEAYFWERGGCDADNESD
jgi:hypothetical protein